MNITIDTSALIAVIGNEASKERIIELTTGCSLVAPASVHWEVGNAFSAMFRRNSAKLETAKQALEVYRRIPIRFIDVSLEQALEIAHGLKIYAYDAYLLQCARQTDTALLTLDKGLVTAAGQMRIKTLEVEP